jgi:hypothetical protein
MYTLEELQQKSIKELKEIGWQLNVLPAGDRRCLLKLDRCARQCKTSTAATAGNF